MITQLGGSFCKCDARTRDSYHAKNFKNFDSQFIFDGYVWKYARSNTTLKFKDKWSRIFWKGISSRCFSGINPSLDSHFFFHQTPWMSTIWRGVSVHNQAITRNIRNGKVNQLIFTHCTSTYQDFLCKILCNVA